MPWVRCQFPDTHLRKDGGRYRTKKNDASVFCYVGDDGNQYEQIVPDDGGPHRWSVYEGEAPRADTVHFNADEVGGHPELCPAASQPPGEVSFDLESGKAIE